MTQALYAQARSVRKRAQDYLREHKQSPLPPLHVECILDEFIYFTESVMTITGGEGEV